LFTREQIEQQKQTLGHVSLLRPMRFEPKLEAIFLDYRYQRLLKRVPAIGIVGLILFTLFSLLDYIFLPDDAAEITMSIRLLLICPLILCVIVFALKAVNARFFIYFYTFVYVFAGAAIVGIIYTADLFAYSLPYDGILLHLVFGYFLMGLPYLMAIYASIVVSIIYFWISFYMQLPLEELVSNAIFMVSLNFMGTIGGFMQDRARRFLFLNEKLVALAKAKDKKEIAAKTRLVAIASHDLRQPLHAMNMLIEELESRLNDPAQLTLAKSLNISIKQLSQMLNTLLDISKLNAGIIQARPERVNLSKKLKDIAEEVRIRARETGITLLLEGDSNVYVRVDPVLFDRILRNLIENIFVHADASEIKLVWQHNGQQVQLAIADNGKGIPLKHLNHIFDEFHQADSHAKTGMGLGLSIVKQLVELQHIGYRIESRTGIGTTFHLVLQSEKESAAAAAAQTVPLFCCNQHWRELPQNWPTRLGEWGYQLVPFELSRNRPLPAVGIDIPADSKVLVWRLNPSVDSEENTSLTAQLNTLMSHLMAQNTSLPAILLLVDNEQQAAELKTDIDSYKRSMARDTLKLEVVSLQVRAAKLRLILNYLMV
jgi:signal transduction histidine kinase